MVMAFGLVGAASAQPCPAPSAANQACTQGCAQLTIGTGSATAGQTVDIPISFAQGADDGQSGQGSDEVAAIAFTLGVPGTGEAAPLQFDCTEGALAAGSVTVGGAIANDFTVVVENAQCNNRSRCLCPTAEGQTRDNFVNVVVYGPKTLPDEGPVQIPTLPDSLTTIATLRMRVAAGTGEGDIPLHVFAATDNGSPVKPQFAANLSLGDQSACDVTGTAQGVSRIGFTDGRVTVGEGGPACVGDCNGNGEVVINELISGVNIALGNAAVSNCVAFDPNNDGAVNINELIQGVNNALNGCPS